MSYTPLFTVAQSAATPNSVTITDTSTGSDAAIVSRRIKARDCFGNYLPSGSQYISWPLATNPIAVDMLTKDTAASITVEWLDSGNNVLYSLENTFCLCEYGKQFYFYLIQQLAQRPATLQDSFFSANLSLFWTYLIGAINAISTGQSLSGSQNLLDLETEMQNNQTFYF